MTYFRGRFLAGPESAPGSPICNYCGDAKKYVESYF